MNRPSLVFVVLAALLAGCTKSPPAPAPTVAQAPVAASPVEASATRTLTPEAPSSAPAPVESTEPQPSAPPATLDGEVSDELRALAAKLVQRDPDGAWRVSESAALELEKQTTDAGTKLLPLLRDPSIDARRGAAFYLLGSFDPSRPSQVEAFTFLLEDSDKTIRGIGLSAVKQMREADIAAAAGKLATMLDPQVEDQPNNRASIVRLLGKLKTNGTAAIDPLLKTAAGDPEPSVRSAALVAIAQIAAPKQAVSAYRQSLTDDSPAVRLVAAARLRSLGQAAVEARSDLGTALADSDPRVAEAAAEALLNIGEPAVSTLVGQLSRKHAASSKLALACLAKMGPAASAAEPAIKKCLEDGDPEVRKLAEIALQKVSGK